MSTPVPISEVTAQALTIPTDAPEADGTIAWTSTTMVLVEIAAGGETGLGYSYCDASAADLVSSKLSSIVEGQSAFAVETCWEAMVSAVRNIGRPGIASGAISAVDTALWDLKARLLDVSLTDLLGPARETVPIYGSGGFTSYTERQLTGQLAGWVDREGCGAVKMKVGSEPESDLKRVRMAREAIGAAELYVDANGAYDRKRAMAFADSVARLGVTWFEEPVSSDDLEGLHLLRDRLPSGIRVAAGEYGYDSVYFRRMLEAGAVDVLQADATRCGGYTGFLRAAALADAWGLPLSAHTAPALHLPVCCAAARLMNVEWFHDHARIEAAIFDGAPVPSGGTIRPDRTRPGNGLTFKRQDAERLVA